MKRPEMDFRIREALQVIGQGMGRRLFEKHQAELRRADEAMRIAKAMKNEKTRK